MPLSHPREHRVVINHILNEVGGGVGGAINTKLITVVPAILTTLQKTFWPTSKSGSLPLSNIVFLPKNIVILIASLPCLHSFQSLAQGLSANEFNKCLQFHFPFLLQPHFSGDIGHFTKQHQNQSEII